MWDFLYVDNETGERFFVECDNQRESVEILRENGFDLSCVELLGKFTPAEAEYYGYDTY